MSLSEAGWALRGALRIAVATAVIALILATTLSDTAAERLATTAYLAGIFAAVSLALLRFIPEDEHEPRPVYVHPFPAFLAFFFGIALLIGTGTALATNPGDEVLALIACFAVVFIVISVRGGTTAVLNALLVRDGALAGAIRYAVLAALCGFGLSAVLPADAAEVTAAFAYRAAALATLLLAIRLIAPTLAGAYLRERYQALAVGVASFARRSVFSRTASYAAIGGVLALIPASILLAPYAEAFATTAYVAAVVACAAVATQCRHMHAQSAQVEQDSSV